MSTIHRFHNPGGYTLDFNPIGRPFNPHLVLVVPESHARGGIQSAAIDRARRMASDDDRSVRIYDGSLHVRNGRVEDSTLAGTLYLSPSGMTEWEACGEGWMP